MLTLPSIQTRRADGALPSAALAGGDQVRNSSWGLHAGAD